LAFLKHFQAKHALGLDPGVGTGSRQENASDQPSGPVLAGFDPSAALFLALPLASASGIGYTLAA
jgi:hypothetical protein